jgi:hypothetical protein
MPSRLAVAAQEAAGLDIIGDGEIARESYSNHFRHGPGRHRPRQSGQGARSQR